MCTGPSPPLIKRHFHASVGRRWRHTCLIGTHKQHPHLPAAPPPPPCLGFRGAPRCPDEPVSVRLPCRRLPHDPRQDEAGCDADGQGGRDDSQIICGSFQPVLGPHPLLHPHRRGSQETWARALFQCRCGGIAGQIRHHHRDHRMGAVAEGCVPRLWLLSCRPVGGAAGDDSAAVCGHTAARPQLGERLSPAPPRATEIPPWHIGGRTCEEWPPRCGCQLVLTCHPAVPQFSRDFLPAGVERARDPRPRADVRHRWAWGNFGGGGYAQTRYYAAYLRFGRSRARQPSACLRRASWYRISFSSRVRPRVTLLWRGPRRTGQGPSEYCYPFSMTGL